MSGAAKSAWERMSEQRDALANAPPEAIALFETLVAAVFPPDARPFGDVTGADPEVASRGPAADRAVAEHAPPSLEERLRAAELRFRTLVEQIPAVTFTAVLGEGANEVYVSPHLILHAMG